MSSTKKLYSTRRLVKELNTAMMNLYLNQAPELLKQIQTQFTEESAECTEIRVGLSIKILHNTPSGTRFTLDVLEPLIRDIESLIKDHNYLRTCESPKHRMRCLKQELNFVQRYINLDDTISLNCAESEMTFIDSQAHTVLHKSEITPQKNDEPNNKSNDEPIHESDDTGSEDFEEQLNEDEEESPDACVMM
jgi:hypothetical protein